MDVQAHQSQTAAATTSDEQLACMALTALTWRLALPPGAVKASAAAGWLTLSGEVRWHYQQQDAAECVRHLPGLAGINNQITRSRP
ncbi:BON domain-containing protein [Roseateles sp.]|jgi:osmotically-inducible protein OsmY|uniref:BON domain-containing protein n=1 Tax=Roseateles sp. TaxID=1971397 RepID=UPI003BA9A524